MVKYTELGNAATVEIPVDLKPSTAPYDPRFPNQNQTRYCYTSFVDFQRCKKRHGEDYDACKYFKKVYSAMCPNSWIANWDDQIENGTFQGSI
ncbi:cytochrome c oxidase subunit 6B1-like isoform X2 [Bombus pascuorum]|uniref:cytochrome c oxidase subunit 6B1-like isoform X2 n=1 Tax=Bombus pascuorum TaxID=65598 RepID=UPI00212BF97D|nr:cytochrome c oxidase subunit 6B1-like isoform X2 [Bombus pascuorum]XP_060814318.1 cytochrome c oxidase subunit 6B1-like isoform X2 [Bombus pascuorum]